MPTVAENPIYTAPRNEAHLRDVLSRIAADLAALAVDVTANDSRLRKTGTAANAVTAGQVVYASSDGGVDLADASSATAHVAAGIAVSDAAMGADCEYQTGGILTIAGWGLTPGEIYYLSTTAGNLVIMVNAGVGEYVVEIGRALTSTSMLINIQQSVLL